MFTVGARSHLWSLMDQIGTGFHIFLSSFCLPASPFISCSSSVPSTSTFLCLSSPCSHVGRCSRAYSMCEWARSCRNMRVSAGRPCVRVAVVFASGRLPCRLPELHIKQAVLQGLSSSLDRTYQLGGGVDGLASNFLTQRLSPGRLPLFLSSLIPPFLSIPIQHTLSQSHWPQLARQTSKVFGGSTKRLKAASPRWLIV